MNEMLKIDNQLCFRLYAVSRSMTRLYQPFLNKFNITYPQYIILLVMFEHKSIDFNKLSKIVDLKTGTLTPILKNLEKQGLIIREKNKTDNRKLNVILSDQGKKLETEIIEVPLAMGNSIKISQEMYETLVKELDSLSLMLKQAVIENEQ